MASDKSAINTEHIHLDAYHKLETMDLVYFLLYEHDISVVSWSETNFLGTEKRER